MIGWILAKVFGSQNERFLRSAYPVVEKVNSLEPEFKALNDEQLKAKTQEFRQRLEQGQSLDDILAEAFALTREASLRVLKMRHFDSQLIGGYVLHKGRIAEMATGEGKTLVATLAVYLNALSGKGVHIVTVNDYLAKRDREWMGPLYEFLGLSVGVILHDMPPSARQQAYACDITYGTNNEFGFDYLRDNMVRTKDRRVQRQLNFAIVDEVDSILIDESRTPLIISGPSDESVDKYYTINGIIPGLKNEEDFQIEEKTKTVALTESGVKKVEKLLHVDNLYDPAHVELVHHVNQALRAHVMFKIDVDYVVKDGEVLIVDEFTGRLMPGRRYSDGLHQALEAKEGVKVEEENQTLATVTFQNYFRMYTKLAGMTGTAYTEAQEFHEIYKLDVVVVPTNRPIIRKDQADRIYRTEREKFNAVVQEIIDCYKKEQPVLVGTVSIEKSELVSSYLRKAGVIHNVLNAKYHEKEAEIIKQAGQPKAITIATNMAGRGTDIVLGPGVKEKGGLHVIGTERHEARRIDNQLRGRSGRQGDPGATRFYLSLEDDLMRIFGSDRLGGVMQKLGMEEGMEIEHPFISRSIEGAQKRVEGRNFEIRKQLLEYDNVMNKQREVIYAERLKVLEGENLKEHYENMIEDVAETICFSLSTTSGEEFFKAVSEAAAHTFAVDLHGLEDVSATDMAHALASRAKDTYALKEKELGSEVIRHFERMVLLDVIDSKWKDHLRAMDNIREGIGLRAYGHKDPLVEYKKEAFDTFEQMVNTIKQEAISFIYRIHPVDASVAAQQASRAAAIAAKEQNRIKMHKPEAQSTYDVLAEDAIAARTPTGPSGPFGSVSGAMPGAPVAPSAPPVSGSPAKVGRNEVCPCGSGKKFKKCCGA